MLVRLIILNGPNPYTEFAVNANPFLIGRKADCQLRLESQSISRHHCELKLKSAGMTVKDLGSTAGTLLNGKKLPAESRVVIHDGDILQVGKYQFKVSISKKSEKDTHAPKASETDEGWKKIKPDKAGKSTTAKEPDSNNHGDTAGNLTTLSTLDDIELGGWAIEANDSEPKGMAVESNDVTYIPHVENDLVRDSQTEAERRKALLEKIKGQPTKDSQDAAEQALKRMFGRR